MKEVRLKSTQELAKMLGIKTKVENKVSMKFIFDNVSPTLQPKIKAAIELYKRSCNAVPEAIEKAEDVIAMVRPLMMDLEHEEVWAVMLDSALHVIEKKKISSGSINDCLIDVNGVCRNALMAKAVGVILVHNHPSGNPMPGQKDVEQTKRLKNALKILDIAMIDHVIVAKGGDSYSFAEEIVFKNEEI